MPDRPVALVTGASGGIGLALAEVLAADGHDLVLVARQEQKLRELAERLRARHGTRSLILASDLAQPGAAAAIAGRLEADGLEVDVLVNNAGFGSLGRFAERPVEEVLAMIQVNVVAVTALTRLFLPRMVARRRGRVLNVSSTAAFQPGPLMAVYYATKAYVQSFTEAVAAEVEGTGVTVTSLAPGPTRSGFQDTAGIGSTPLVTLRRMPDAASVARAGYEGLLRGRRTVIPGLANRLSAQAHRFLPRRLLTALVRRLQESRTRA